MSGLVTSREVKERAVMIVGRFLERAGCAVAESRSGDVVTFVVTIPPDSGDPHGDRLRAARGVVDSEEAS